MTDTSGVQTVGPEDNQPNLLERTFLGQSNEPGLTLSGPNATEAEKDLQVIRGNPGGSSVPKDQPLPPIYRAMAQARAAGYPWQEVDGVVGDVKDAMAKSGYSDHEIANYLYGVPIDTAPSALSKPVDSTGAIFPAMDRIANSIKQFATDHVGPDNPFDRAGLIEPGTKGSDIWKSMGWDAVNSARTFGASVINGAGALAEAFDGKQRNPWEWAKLEWEMAPFVLLFTPAPKGATAEAKAAAPAVGPGMPKPPPGATPFPKPEEFFDGAMVMAQKAGTAKDEAAVSGYMRDLGDHWRATGEHPVEAAQKVGTEGFELQKPPPNGDAWTHEPVAGLLPSRLRIVGPKAEDVSVEDMATAMGAEDRAVPPGRTDFNPEELKNKTFKDFMADQSGGINMPQMDITPERLYQKDPEIAEGIVQNVKSIVTPYSLAPNAAEMLAANRAQSVAMTERSVGNLVRFGRAVGDLSTPERWAFIDGLESGQWRPAMRTADMEGTPLAALHDQLRAELDFRWKELDKRGIAPGYVEDYLPHLYADPAKFSNYFAGNGTLAGAKSFTRQRVLGSYAEARAAGLVPATDNPINMTIQALRQMDQYIGAFDSVKELADSGVVKAIARGDAAPGSWVRINGKLGVGKTGTLYAPRDVAALVNSLVDPGFSQYSLYRMARDMSMTTFRTKLALSGFHATFVALDSVNSAVALAAQQFSRLAPSEMIEGIKTALTAPGAPVRNYLSGKKLGSILAGTEDMVSAQDQKIADMFLAGGGRAHLDPIYRGSAYGSYLSALKGTFVPSSGRATLGQEIAQTIRDAQPVTAFGHTIVPSYVKAAYQIIVRMLDTTSAPLMEHLVPTLKRGVFYQGMSDYLRAFPTAGDIEMRSYAHTLLKSVDNRLGEMVQDNRFWNKYLRDAMQIVYPALGWRAGTISELGGGTLDLLGGRAQAVGQYNQITQRTAYLVALPLVTALASAVFGYMKGTWNPQWDAKDYMAPPTGGTDQHGNPERAIMPGYHKDAWEMWNQPGQYASGGLNPLALTLWRAMQNRDWNGAAITDPGAPTITNLDDYADWTMKQLSPFTLQQMENIPEESNLGPSERFFGIRPAPTAIADPDIVQKAQEREQRGAVRKMERQRSQQ